MEDAANLKQSILDNIKKSTNILVTVSSSPSVDALAAALALTLIINKLDKHGTAVFSGVIPPAINFLEPDKTFENNVDGLRDFIIALDKEKADRLRYKVENDVVRIFITPYRTTITQNDLQFSQGDFNVDLIIALGVEKREELDKAITAHGRILHDATVITINAGNQVSSLGTIDLHDPGASSLSEMLVGMAEALKPGILDQQISNSLLAGIVAATDRFGNDHTTPQVMNAAAQLMAAGANQQLIAKNLRQNMQTIPNGDVSKKITAPKKPEQPANPPEKTTADGEMHIKHDGNAKKSPAKKQPQETAPTPATPEATQQAEAELEAALPVAPAPAESVANLKQALQEETPLPKAEAQATPLEEKPTPGSKTVNDQSEPEASTEEPEESYVADHPSWKGRNIQPPSMGGTLNATSEQAMKDNQQSRQDERNQTLLSHDAKEEAPVAGPALPPVEPLPVEVPEVPSGIVVSEPTAQAQPQAQPAILDSLPLQTEPSIEQLEQEVKEKQPEASEPAAPAPNSEPDADLNNARQAVDEALASQPFNPANQPLASVGAQPMPEEPAAPAASPTPLSEPVPQPNELPAFPPVQPPMPGPAASTTPGLPPMPDFSSLPPLPPLPGQAPASNQSTSGSTPPAAPDVLPPLPPLPQAPANPAGPSSNDPGQFRIPGQ